MQKRAAAFAIFALLGVASAPDVARAQILRDPGSIASSSPGDPGTLNDAASARRAQAEFEQFRLASLPGGHGGGNPRCDEQVGNICYWYDEREPPPPLEPPVIKQHRDVLITLLDSAAVHSPNDRWVAEQRVRYLAEAGRLDSALSAAHQCKVGGWYCDLLAGFSLHLLGRYRAADSVYSHAISQMLQRDKCDWRNIDMLIDDDTRQQYHRYACGDPQREAFENRAWYFARTLYSLDGNDSRTEHFARKTMEMMMRDAPGMLLTDSQEDDIEVMLRFGWPRAWSVSTSYARSQGGFGMGMRGPPNARPAPVRTITGYEPVPAYRYIPAGIRAERSGDFRFVELAAAAAAGHRALCAALRRFAHAARTSEGDVQARRHGARRARLRRARYEAAGGGKLTAALVVTPGDKPADYGKIVHDAPETGVLTARGAVGPAAHECGGLRAGRSGRSRARAMA